MGPLATAAEVSPPERARVEAAILKAEEEFAKGDLAACRNALAEVKDSAWGLHSPTSYRWFDMMVNCTFWVDHQPTLQATLEALLPLLDPWRLRLKGNPENAPDEEIGTLYQYWRLLIQMGHRGHADQVFMAELRSRIHRLAAQPEDAVARSDLMFVARITYGSMWLHDYTRSFYERFRDALGADDPITLVAMRSVAYGEGFLGRPQEALKLAESSVELATRNPRVDERLRIGLMAQRASARASIGRLAEALADNLVVRDALLQREPPPLEGLVRTHYNLAGIALDMGDHRAAIDYADRSIAYARQLGGRAMQSEAIVPAAIREVARAMLGEPGAAHALKEAIEPTLAQEMHIGSQAFFLVQHAARAGDRELLGWASAFMNKYIGNYRTPFHTDRALVPLMNAWQLGGVALQSPEVRGDLDRALAGSISGRSPSIESLTQFNLARHLAPRQPDEAVWLYKRGANALQQLRQGLPTGNAELHRTWLAAHEADLRNFIGLLIDRGRLVEAEQAVLFLRDEEMVEYTRRSRASRATAVQALSYTASESARNASRATAVQALSYTASESARNAGFDALAQRVQQAATKADKRADEWRTMAYKYLYRDDEADQALAGFQSEVHQLLVPAAPGSTEEAPPRGASQPALPPGTARLTYFVREGAVDVVMQRGRERRSVSVPIARDELNRRVQALRVALGSPQRDALAPSRALHQVLIAPIDKLLKAAGSVHLQIVPDAVLRYVPFAALHDGQRFLAQRLVLMTDLNGSAGRGGPAVQARGIVAFGRSQGDNEHSALPGVERELAAVGRRRGSVALNSAFTQASLQSGLARNPALVHIASHFVLSPAGEDKSYLLLGDGQRLSLTELRQMPWQGVQLALLSACDSAVTVDAGNGRELVGFATALQGAGARNVLASLWRVPDGATAQWMEMFYAQQALRAGRPVSPGTLARTQRLWLHTHAGTPMAHPHYWAAFSWIGVP